MNLYPLILTVRFGSSRLPGKCLLPFSKTPNQNESVLEHVINRAQSEGRQLIVCTGESNSNDVIAQMCKEMNIQVFRGSEENKILRWNDCFRKFDLKWAHFVDVDDPFFCNSELNLSIQTYQSSHKVVVSTEKSKSGNASVGMTFGANHMIRMHAAVGHLSNFEMVDDLIEDLFGNETASIESLDPIPTGTRLTLDYFEDYLSLSLIKLGLSTKATRDEVYTYINLNPWILDINASRNAEWKARQNAILRSQEMWNEH